MKIPFLISNPKVGSRAFHHAKTALKKRKGVGYDGDDYVSYDEFYYLLKYLRQFSEYWIAFSQLDKDHDNKITASEFEAGKEVMAKWGVVFDEKDTKWRFAVDTDFSKMDDNKGGVIMFDEFVEWAIEKNLDLPDDDDKL